MPNQQLQPVAATQPEQVAGLVERVTFHNDETGFRVLRIKARGHGELVTVVGTLPAVAHRVRLGVPCRLVSQSLETPQTWV